MQYSSAIELGRLARLSPEERREFARLGGIARQRKAAADRKALLGLRLLNDEPGWSSMEPIGGDISEYIDRVWLAEIVRGWQRGVDLAFKSGDLDAMLSVLMPMTAMCPQLVSHLSDKGSACFMGRARKALQSPF